MDDERPSDAHEAALISDLSDRGDDLGVRPFVFRHRLADDRRFAGDELGELIARLPCAWVLAHEAQYSPHECRGKDPLPADVDLAQVTRELPTSRASIRAYNLEHTTTFRQLLDDAERAASALVGTREGGVAGVNLAAFVASAGAVTAAHPDRHHNLLLQVTGEKRVWVDDEADRRRHHTRTLVYLRAPSSARPSCRRHGRTCSRPARACTYRPTRGTGPRCSATARPGCRSVSARRARSGTPASWPST
jgi:hypothetical protein